MRARPFLSVVARRPARRTVAPATGLPPPRTPNRKTVVRQARTLCGRTTSESLLWRAPVHATTRGDLITNVAEPARPSVSDAPFVRASPLDPAPSDLTVVPAANGSASVTVAGPSLVIPTRIGNALDNLARHPSMVPDRTFESVTCSAFSAARCGVLPHCTPSMVAGSGGPAPAPGRRIAVVVGSPSPNARLFALMNPRAGAVCGSPEVVRARRPETQYAWSKRRPN